MTQRLYLKAALPTLTHSVSGKKANLQPAQQAVRKSVSAPYAREKRNVTHHRSDTTGMPNTQQM